MIHIIQKSLINDISVEEQQLLSQWRAEDPANEHTYKQFAEAWNLANQYGTPAWDTPGAFSRFENRIKASQSVPKTKTPKLRSLWKRYSAVAAIAVLFIAGGAYLWSGQDRTEWIEVIAQEEDQEIELEDGSVIHLRKGSKVYRPEIFASDERRVKIEGEAFFQVEPEANRPFIVSTARTEVKVLGTEFAVNASEENVGRTEVYVTKGKVRFQPINSTTFLDIKGGQQAYLQNNALDYIERTTFNDIAWHTGKLVFIGVSVSRAVEDLESYYGITIDESRSEISRCPFNAPYAFQQLSFEAVADIMSELFLLEVKQTGEKEYAFIGGACK